MIADPNDTVERFCRNWDGVTPYARATIVHTQGATAAKAGAKAIVTAEGELIGWIGGGCIRGAVMRAARQAIDTATPRLIRVRPREDITAERDPDGVELHASGCPSRGRAEVFIEPVMPKPPLVIIGKGQIACALADLGTSLPVDILAIEGSGEAAALSALPERPGIERGFIVIATQGAGDFSALASALKSEAPYIAFIASRAKAKAMRDRLASEGIPEESLARLHAPAGLDIGAKTAAEIAISILAEIVRIHRG